MSDKHLTDENYLTSAFKFRDRQAGVSVIYNPKGDFFTYNAYCLETKIMKELFTVEHDYLDDAIQLINDEFGSWEFIDLASEKSSCGSCVAK